MKVKVTFVFDSKSEHSLVHCPEQEVLKKVKEFMLDGMPPGVVLTVEKVED